MSADRPPFDLPASTRLQIEQLASRYERQWQEGNPPVLADFLAGWTGTHADALLATLQKIDRRYRQEAAAQGIRISMSPGKPPTKLDNHGISETATIAPDGTLEQRPQIPAIVSNRFLPGELLANRYRVVALLGRGGMGEVYRAEDLRLGQTVALKFLPHQQVAHPRQIQYFYDEVRLSQRLAHPHICRVHDLIEIGPLRCLSMEYIEGENLQTLLRRIGPLPEAKGIELAHQICQGLAAAHAAGILHRDLKTANIMIDERGRARITDFGLACEHNRSDPREGLVGSPSYMAPEQLAENKTSVQSDLYSLGLILLEILTGRSVHRSRSLNEIAQWQSDESAREFVLDLPGISTTIAHAIAACLAKDPAQRPRSATALAARLPGHSPLSVALAAGETPSPDMVTSADAGLYLSRFGRSSLIITIIVVLVAVVFLSASAYSRFGTERNPAVLADQASQILDNLQLARGNWRASGYTADRRALQWLANQGRSPSAAEAISTNAYLWYRESPTAMAPLVPDWTGEAFLTVDEFRPPPIIPGSVLLRLDGTGRLRYFSVVPDHSQLDNSPHRRGEWAALGAARDLQEQTLPGGELGQEWNRIFTLAGLTADQIRRLEPIEADFTPPGFADHRWSWELAADPQSPWKSLRFDAASWNARPSFFRVQLPWDRDQPPIGWTGITRDNPVLAAMMIIWVPILFGVSGWLAQKNLKSRRADRSGANRLAAFCAIAVLLVWLLGSTHVWAELQLDLFVTALAAAALMATAVWAAYVAFEPLVRRHWPRSLVSWNRVLRGRFTDPLVGRHLLIGTAAGVVAALGKLLLVEGPQWFGGHSYGLPNIYNFAPLSGIRGATAEVIAAIGLAILYSLFFQLLFLMALQLTFRKNSIAVALFVIFLAGRVAIQYQPAWLAFAITAIEMTVAAALYLRVGLLAAVTMHFVRLMLKWPLATDPTLWYAETSGFALAIIGGIIIFAAYTTRPLSLASDLQADGDHDFQSST